MIIILVILFRVFILFFHKDQKQFQDHKSSYNLPWLRFPVAHVLFGARLRIEPYFGLDTPRTFRDYFSGKSGCKNQSRRRAAEEGGISWVSWQRKNYFESAALIRFGKIYLIFMSVCFKFFDLSHNFSKTTTPTLNHVVCMSPTSFF